MSDNPVRQRLLVTFQCRSSGQASATATTFANNTDPTVFDRSGLRSALQDFNQDGIIAADEDINGTILDGDGDGISGGDSITLLAIGDTFTTALTISVPQDAIFTAVTAPSGIDVYHFTTTNPFDYFSAQYQGGDAFVEMALFLLDDQGNGDPDDDTYEAVTRQESANITLEGNFELFMAFEMPEVIGGNGEYYLVVASDQESSENYSLTFTRASTDQGLVTLLGGALPSNERIAYVSNQVNDENNMLGANEPKQLVYVNFDGGTSTLIDGTILFQPFDAADFDATFVGSESDLIHSGGGVTGIMANLVTIFSNTPTSHPDGTLNVQLLVGSDLTAFTGATDGLFFTTVDPIASGLDPSIDFSTIFVGDPDKNVLDDVFGQASQVDLANLDKSDEAAVVTSTFQNISTATTLNEYSRAFANIIGHELGHLLGLNHQPTDRVNFALIPDDPNNDDVITSDIDDINDGLAGLMAYTPNSDASTDNLPDNDLIDSLHYLGTAPLSSAEFR